MPTRRSGGRGSTKTVKKLKIAKRNGQIRVYREWRDHAERDHLSLDLEVDRGEERR